MHANDDDDDGDDDERDGGDDDDDVEAMSLPKVTCAQADLEENCSEGKRKLRIIQGAKGRPRNQLQCAATEWAQAKM